MSLSEGEERPLAWNAILDLTPVFECDGEEVGRVHEVLGAEDIFHGLVITHGVRWHEMFIPGERVLSITNRRVDLKLNAGEVHELPPYEPEASYQLGFKGLFGKHLAWVRDREGRHRDRG